MSKRKWLPPKYDIWHDKAVDKSSIFNRTIDSKSPVNKSSSKNKKKKWQE